MSILAAERPEAEDVLDRPQEAVVGVGGRVGGPGGNHWPEKDGVKRLGGRVAGAFIERDDNQRPIAELRVRELRFKEASKPADATLSELSWPSSLRFGE